MVSPILALSGKTHQTAGWLMATVLLAPTLSHKVPFPMEAGTTPAIIPVILLVEVGMIFNTSLLVPSVMLTGPWPRFCPARMTVSPGLAEGVTEEITGAALAPV